MHGPRRHRTCAAGRELWLEALGLSAQLPPPEEKQEIKTGIAAARVEKERHTAVMKSVSGKARK